MRNEDTRGLTRRTALRAAATVGAVAGPLGLVGTAASPAAAEPGATLPAATTDVTPFRLSVSDSALRDLQRRLAATRFPERATVPDGSQGVPLERVRALVEHWRTRYDWRRVEARLNGFGQFRTQIDGLGIHFLHVRSRHASAVPVVLTHGWPGSVVEFLDMIGPLTDPTAFGGSAADAFHVVVPSLPGFGFSDKPGTTGWNIQRIAKAWAELMSRLGYRRWLAQGGDLGGSVTHELAKLGPAGLAGIHLNFFPVFQPPVSDPPTPPEQEALDKLRRFFDDGAGFIYQQSTRPQTLGYALTDSPVGQAAWIYEKFMEWTDSDGNPERVLGVDRMLDDIMLYWLPGTAASSARIYWEDARAAGTADDFTVPVGFTVFPHEIIPTPRVWAERVYESNLVYFNTVTRGGHFAAFEQPEILTEELRRFARLVR
ncbi:epoxide hydrolase family protein [Plantactinospora sp. CA-294935]|uniref:epoxide hydrolase family protein n=1 Tax=Plantactinospora sp. CA-294935 TaxID=3240012 RepID=UPI003D8E06D8